MHAKVGPFQTTKLSSIISSVGVHHDYVWCSTKINLYVENHEILEATPALLVLTTINSGYDASRKRQWVDPSCREQGNLVGNFNQP